MIEPENISKTAQRYMQENLKFIVFLIGHADSDELDMQTKMLHEELFKGYDCCSCNNCCRDYNICFNDDDVKRIAGFLEMDKKAFRDKYLHKNDGEHIIEPPCIFLEADGRCRIQEIKPEECVNFPYTDMPHRLGSLYSIMDFTQSCPVVFEIVQRLKKIYGFKDR